MQSEDHRAASRALQPDSKRRAGDVHDCVCPPASPEVGCSQAVQRHHPRQLHLVLCGLPAALSEKAALLGDILGWAVTILPPGPVMRPRADLCLATIPADTATPAPAIAIWSPDNILNEHISAAGLSILDQPLCVQQLEQLLEIASTMSSVSGQTHHDEVRA